MPWLHGVHLQQRAPLAAYDSAVCSQMSHACMHLMRLRALVNPRVRLFACFHAGLFCPVLSCLALFLSGSSSLADDPMSAW
eukprot:1137155-Pelagomonas_calceolata.AAC.4